MQGPVLSLRTRQEADWVSGFLRLGFQLRHLGCDPPRLVAGEQLGRRAAEASRRDR
jgi:hypothetical protein